METVPAGASEQAGPQGDVGKSIRTEDQSRPYIERAALGAKGLLLGSSEHMFFRYEGKDYYITSHDVDLKILSTDACLREERDLGNENIQISFPRAIDFLEDVVGEARDAEPQTPAAGLIGCLHPNTPFKIYVRVLENQLSSVRAYQIWHSHLEVEIIDEDAAFYFVEGQKYNKYWDGFLDYTSASMEPLTSLLKS